MPAKSIDEQWNDLLGENSCSSENANDLSEQNVSNSLSFIGNQDSSSPQSCLLGRFMKRQRVNSAATKFEFSFKPTFKPTTSPNFNKNASAPEKPNSPLSTISAKNNSIRPRDIKASKKIVDCFSLRNGMPGKAADQDRFPKVHIQVDAIFDSFSEKQSCRPFNTNLRGPMQNKAPKNNQDSGISKDDRAVFEVTKNLLRDDCDTRMLDS